MNAATNQNSGRVKRLLRRAAKSMNSHGSEGAAYCQVVAARPVRGQWAPPSQSCFKASAFLVAMAWFAALGTGGKASASVAAPLAKLAVALKAEPFDPSAVRLLPGPFLHSQELDHQYLLKLEPDRLLAWYRKEAGLAPRAPVYGGWETEGVAGHSLGHYLSACSEMFAATGDEQLLSRVNYIVEELAACQAANGNGYVAAIPRGKQIFSEISHGIITSQGFDLNGGWVPFYTLHKEMAGLRDAYRLCGNAKALEVERKLADFVSQTLSGLDHGQMQKILACEHGGMNEALADLYADIGDTKYLKLSRRFYHEAVLVPLTQRQDRLRGLHANTQIPKLIGLADLYEWTGDTNDCIAASFFWDRIAHHHSYVTGGDGLDEHLGEPDHLNDRLGENTSETCNVYNMLKLTRHIFEWTASAEAVDFYERALLNHILASQNPEDGRVVYNLTLAMGGRKHFQEQFNSFTCCVGTGMENHARHGAAIYFHTEDSLYVNLFIASELNWAEKGVRVRQQTKFPEADTSELSFECERPLKLILRVRHPSWVENGFGIAVNGESLRVKSARDEFEEVEREWKSGDRLKITAPRSLRVETMPDNTNRVAIFYGPIVLAGDLGPENDPKAGLADYVPVLVTANRPVSDWLKPLDLQQGLFRTERVGRPRDVELRPFYGVYDRRYTVFWDLFTPSQWEERRSAYAAQLEERRQIEARTVDFLQPGEMQPERDHHFEGEQTRAGELEGHKWRDAYDGGWMSWQMKVPADAPVVLALTYWGSDGGRRVFDVMVDGQKITTQKLDNNRPGQFYDETYRLPDTLTRGKSAITIRLAAHPGNLAGGFFGARILRTDAQTTTK